MLRKPKLPTIFFLFLIGLTFSPIVMPEKLTSPWFLGMPRVLWAGILISLTILILTLLVALRSSSVDEHE